MRDTIKQCISIGFLTLGSVALANTQLTFEQAYQAINPQSLIDDIKVLSSDEFAGRAPTGIGADKTQAFLKQRFVDLGLSPGNGQSYFQSVPLVEITADPAMELRMGDEVYQYGTDYVAVSKHVTDQVKLKDAELVFLGYGVRAPEYNWDDYDIDVKGKVVVVLVNDPGFATQDAKLFNGKAMTYYGRWTYKYEEASRQGAAAVFIVHETLPASYPWGVVKSGWTGPQFDLVAPDKNFSRVPVEGWFSVETTKKLFEKAGLSFEELKLKALKKDFKPVSLQAKANLLIKNSYKQSTSNNVLAAIKGSKRPDEYIVYSAHWDHLGTDEGLDGDKIYNGALDNATGTSALLALANAFQSLKQRPERSILFVAATAEEQGLLGSKYYAQNPVVPTDKTVAALNMDSLNIIGKMKDIAIIGFGNSELENYVAVAAKAQDRVVKPEASPERGAYYRSDHFNFAKVGIPALFLGGGVEHRERGKTWAQMQSNLYVTRRYHKPSDEYDEKWDLSGGIEDVQILFQVGHTLANEKSFPNWFEGNEFKAIRDQDLQ